MLCAAVFQGMAARRRRTGRQWLLASGVVNVETGRGVKLARVYGFLKGPRMLWKFSTGTVKLAWAKRHLWRA